MIIETQQCLCLTGLFTKCLYLKLCILFNFGNQVSKLPPKKQKQEQEQQPKQTTKNKTNNETTKNKTNKQQQQHTHTHTQRKKTVSILFK